MEGLGLPWELCYEIMTKIEVLECSELCRKVFWQLCNTVISEIELNKRFQACYHSDVLYSVT